MVLRKYIQDDKIVYSQVNYIEDCLDLNRFWINRTFSNFKDLLFGDMSDEKTAFDFACEIVEDFFQMIADSIINDIDFFVFPVMDSIMLGVKRVVDIKNMPGYYYNIKSEGRAYTPKVIFKERKGEIYFLKLNLKWAKVLRNNINQGIHYS